MVMKSLNLKLPVNVNKWSLMKKEMWRLLVNTLVNGDFKGCHYAPIKLSNYTQVDVRTHLGIWDERLCSLTKNRCVSVGCVPMSKKFAASFFLLQVVQLCLKSPCLPDERLLCSPGTLLHVLVLSLTGHARLLHLLYQRRIVFGWRRVYEISSRIS